MALNVLAASALPSEHKAVLIEAVTQVLRDQEVARTKASLENPSVGEPWQENGTEQLQSFLQGKVARSWQHADELVMRLAAVLHRDPREVRTKAMESGFGAVVDYNQAKELARAVQG